MRFRTSIGAVALAAAAVAAVHAAAGMSVSVGSSGHADTETVTNVAFSAGSDEVLRFCMSFDAGASNNAERIFGRDADGDGALTLDEERLCVGWDCGRWKVVDCRELSSVQLPASAVSGRTNAYWRVEFIDSDVYARVGGEQMRLVGDVPMAAAEFDMVKVVCRGIQSPELMVRHPAHPVPFTIFIR